MPHTDTLWMDYGSGANLQVWAIETSGYNNVDVANYKEEHAVSFPFFSTMSDFGNAFLLDSFPINYTPWFYVICPDRSVEHVEFDSLRVFIDECAASKLERIIDETLQVYYSNHLVNIVSDKSQEWTLSIYNVSGQKIESQEIFINKKASIIFQYSVGLYLVQLTDKKGRVIVKKVFVN